MYYICIYIIYTFREIDINISRVMNNYSIYVLMFSLAFPELFLNRSVKHLISVYFNESDNDLYSIKIVGNITNV